MSLTSELDDSKSKVRLFMVDRFPNTAAVCQAVNPQLRPLNRPSIQGYDYGMIGTAFDYVSGITFGLRLMRNSLPA
ncbi:MAG: hypothetical protein DMG05_28460 [Acidobacteria bacterium]|nr:MAG: hypothetical protein DMG05_28460 [Acidobacteriota bacterium]